MKRRMKRDGEAAGLPLDTHVVHGGAYCAASYCVGVAGDPAYLDWVC